MKTLISESLQTSCELFRTSWTFFFISICENESQGIPPTTQEGTSLKNILKYDTNIKFHAVGKNWQGLEVIKLEDCR